MKLHDCEAIEIERVDKVSIGLESFKKALRKCQETNNKALRNCRETVEKLYKKSRENLQKLL